jgi:hypothetical protein
MPASAQHLTSLISSGPIHPRGLSRNPSSGRQHGILENPPPINIAPNVPNARYVDDTAIVENATYQYTVCLQGAGGPACANTTVAVPAFNPTCKQSLICGGSPPIVQTVCSVPVDFYETNWTPLPNETPTTYSGVDQLVNPQTYLACKSGSKTICTSFSQFLSAGSCPPPRPPKPLPNCSQCIKTGRQCEKVAGGYFCKGNIQ